jgi:hypothetical protein
VILDPGDFIVKKYRKPIPEWIKRQLAFEAGRDEILPRNTDMRDVEFDHDPSLNSRPYDTEIGDFIPAQHDKDYILPRLRKDHAEKTFGRKADAEKTVTTRGSDVGEAARIKRMNARQKLSEVRLAAKAGDPQALAHLLGVEKPKRPRSKIPSRPFPKKQRQLRNSG